MCPYDLNVPGGVQGQVTMMATELARRGRQVVLVSPGARPDSFAEAGVEHIAVGRSHRLAANGSDAPVSLNLAAARRASVLLQSASSTVIHLHEPLAPVVGWPLLASRQMGLVGTFHRAGVDRTYRLAGALLGWLAKRLDLATAVSPAAAQTVEEVIGITPMTLFNGIDVALYASAAPWPTSGPTCLFLGRDEPRKGRDVLLAAAALLDPGITIWTSGDAPPGWQPTHGAEVKFLGRIQEDEKRRRLRGADVVVAPARGGESFGMVLLEGLASGAVVVASDIDGYRQALDGAGILVAPGDPVSLANGISRALGRKNREIPAPRALKFSVSELVDRYEPLYDEAAFAAAMRK